MSRLPPPIQTRPMGPPPPYAPTSRPVGPPQAAPVFDRYGVEYRVRRRMQCAYAGLPVNHPNPAGPCGKSMASSIEVMVQAVVDEIESIVSGRLPVDPRQPRDDEYLPDPSLLFPKEPKHEARRPPPAVSPEHRGEDADPEDGSGGSENTSDGAWSPGEDPS